MCCCSSSGQRLCRSHPCHLKQHLKSWEKMNCHIRAFTPKMRSGGQLPQPRDCMSLVTAFIHQCIGSIAAKWTKKGTPRTEMVDNCSWKATHAYR